MDTHFTEGDIFYTILNNEYHVFKLLVFEEAFDCYHVLVYAPLKSAPNKASIDELEIMMYHTPIDKNGFPGAEWIANRDVVAAELIGYHEYVRQTKDVEFRAALANQYFKKAYDLTDEGLHENAIDFYTKTFDLFPEYFEAIDNRAFCKMDLARWEDAIEDFKLSLTVNPLSPLAEFSIGECYLRLKKYPEAKQQFEKALTLNPDHELSKQFLDKVNALM